MNFNLLCVYIGYFFMVLNVVLYTVSFFQVKKANGFFMTYLYFAFIMNAIMYVYYILHRSNLVFMNLFFIGDMVLLGLFYSSILKTKWQKMGVKLSIVTALLFLIIQIVLNVKQLFTFNLFVIALTCTSLVIFAVMHLYNMLTDKKDYYYFTIGLILYLSSSTILYLVGGLTVKLPDNVKLISWNLNAVLMIVYQLFILYEWNVGFFVRKSK
ncbi:hypothetical protein [Flavobacterium sp.]|uniref:hypothetical protein n=1 Tax=Flavobacterium sp. TaxID=239 RepID=UPI00262FC772|nr:hypothetical protein [Flavobacterium sp.]